MIRMAIGVSIKMEKKNSQKNDYLMADFTCVGTHRFEKNKKNTYCKKCIHALVLHDGVVCPFGLNDNW